MSHVEPPEAPDLCHDCRWELALCECYKEVPEGR